MISFFRKIRQKLLQQNRVRSYLAYAVGEILLVMVGILIAMQVNNWNEERKRKEEFSVTMEQVYNILEIEIQSLRFIENHLAIKNMYMDSLYNFSDKMDVSSIPGHLNYQESQPKSFQTSLGFLVQNLKIKPGNPEEIRLARNLTDYVSLAKLDFSSAEKPIKEILLREGIPTPELTFGIAHNQKGINLAGIVDSSHISKSQELIQTTEVRHSLIRSTVQNGNYLSTVFHVREVAEQLQSQIKTQYPDVKLLYENLGIIGTGTPNQDWQTDIPFTKVSDSPALWESEINLMGGEVKFRENGTWSRNWGGQSFPLGFMEWEGPNIEAPAGTYRIMLNLTDKTYEFIPLNP